jgi:hypothetical protein
LVRDNGAECGLILHESKNRRDFKAEYARKFKADVIKAGADVGILTTRFFSPGTRDVAEYEGVILCHPRHVVTLTGIVRHYIIAMAALRSAGKGADSKAAAILDYVTSERFQKLFAVLSNGRLRGLDKDLREYVERNLKHRAQDYTLKDRALSEIADDIARHVRGDDGEAF